MKKVKLLDIGGGRATMSFPAAATVDDIQTFMSLRSYMGVVGITSVTPTSVTPTTPQAGSNVDRKLRIFYRVISTGKNEFFDLPAPVIAGVVGKRGERITKAQAQEILVAWLTANGFTSTSNFAARRGVFLQRI